MWFSLSYLINTGSLSLLTLNKKCSLAICLWKVRKLLLNFFHSEMCLLAKRVLCGIPRQEINPGSSASPQWVLLAEVRSWAGKAEPSLFQCTFPREISKNLHPFRSLAPELAWQFSLQPHWDLSLLVGLEGRRGDGRVSWWVEAFR